MGTHIADSIKSNLPELKRHAHRRAIAMVVAAMIILIMLPTPPFGEDISPGTSNMAGGGELMNSELMMATSGSSQAQ